MNNSLERVSDHLKENQSIILCLIAGLFAFLKMYSGNNMFLVVFLIVVSFGIITDRMGNKIEYLLFFIPWVYALKFELTQFSLLTILSALYIVCCVFYALIKNIKVSKTYLLAYMLFVIYSISIPLFNYGNVAVTLGFILNYTTIFFAALFIKSRGLIRRYIILHAFGLLASCIVRYIGYSISTINQYFQGIESDYGFLAKGTYHNRFSGMDEDPNYFAIQVLIALACLLVCIYFEKKKRIGLIVLFTSLTIFGILSYSKMFLLVLAALAIISFFILLRENRKFALNYILLVALAGGITFYNYYDYFYSAFLVRFGSGIDSVSEITTGRFDIWVLYVQGIFSDVRVLLLGEGYGAGALNSVGAHNMYLTALYYMGILGLVVTLSFFNCMKLVIRTNLTVKSRFKIFSISSIPFLILLIANFSLDSFVMDFFPFQLLLLMACFCYKEGIQLKDDMLLSKVS